MFEFIYGLIGTYGAIVIFIGLFGGIIVWYTLKYTVINLIRKIITS
ncbi:hypothetical protein NEF87_003892 [Candidatus Lokiarchaeum ossiferum]|uniref:Uncharacterized protein n=1 Tax=Candidatus Lokiarchaeum ossiferum TaxID=2951803 RepID=A0ABY6HXM6_9ARCH|nr:hypothetical protein NEF87_003892 [Candidatus Lokiarchaeum sp. B-35]